MSSRASAVFFAQNSRAFAFRSGNSAHVIRTVLWILLLGAFAVVGVCGVVQRIEWRPPVFRSATSTTDEVAQSLFGSNNGTELLAKALEKFPQDSALMVVGPGMDWRLSEMQYLASYVAWPRPVWALGQVEAGHLSIFSYLPKDDVKPAAMLFYISEPPPELAAHALTLAQDLKIVTLQ